MKLRHQEINNLLIDTKLGCGSAQIQIQMSASRAHMLLAIKLV